jgi:hypothetical protein
MGENRSFPPNPRKWHFSVCKGSAEHFSEFQGFPMLCRAFAELCRAFADMFAGCAQHLRTCAQTLSECCKCVSTCCTSVSRCVGMCRDVANVCQECCRSCEMLCDMFAKCRHCCTMSWQKVVTCCTNYFWMYNSEQMLQMLTKVAEIVLPLAFPSAVSETADFVAVWCSGLSDNYWYTKCMAMLEIHVGQTNPGIPGSSGIGVSKLALVHGPWVRTGGSWAGILIQGLRTLPRFGRAVALLCCCCFCFTVASTNNQN